MDMLKCPRTKYFMTVDKKFPAVFYLTGNYKGTLFKLLIQPVIIWPRKVYSRNWPLILKVPSTVGGTSFAVELARPIADTVIVANCS